MHRIRSFMVGSIVLALAACAAEGEDSASVGNELNVPTDPKDPIVKPAPEPTSTGEFTLTLGTPALEVGLGDSVEIPVTVTMAEEFNGDVDLGVTGLTPGVTVETVTLATASDHAEKTTTTKLVVSASVTSFVTPKDTTVPITVTATSGKATATAPATFKVLPKVTLYIPMNVQALYQAAGGPLRPEWGEAFGPNNQPMRTQVGNGIAVTVFNRDSKAHILHGPGGAFPHGEFNGGIQPNSYEMKNGAPRVRTMNVGNSAVGYIHGEPNSTNAQWKMVVAATPEPTPVTPPVTP
jgi:hypothetical protein